MTYTLKPIDDAFFETAPIVIPATLELKAPPEHVWEALGSDAMWSWAPIIDQLVWTTRARRPWARSVACGCSRR